MQHQMKLLSRIVNTYIHTHTNTYISHANNQVSLNIVMPSTEVAAACFFAQKTLLMYPTIIVIVIPAIIVYTYICICKTLHFFHF